jgi:hypothetical protein
MPLFIATPMAIFMPMGPFNHLVSAAGMPVVNIMGPEVRIAIDIHPFKISGSAVNYGPHRRPYNDIAARGPSVKDTFIIIIPVAPDNNFRVFSIPVMAPVPVMIPAMMIFRPPIKKPGIRLHRINEINNR